LVSALTHNGIDIDQYILLTIYPTAVFFGLGFLTKRNRAHEPLKYALQGISCIIFSIAYFVLIPNGGADGLAIVLVVFGVLLMFMARNQRIHPAELEDVGKPDDHTSSKEI
jgi:Na+/H+-dicarboxylate symporter